MPESTFLHIQARDSAPTRVLEIPGVSVRIGKGAQCEVRLGEPTLAEVQCMLRKRGDSWHIQPVGPPGRVSIEGRAIEQPRPLPIGVVVRVGNHWLTLKQAETSPVDSWGSYPTHAPSPFPDDRDRPGQPGARRESTLVVEGNRDHLQSWKERQEQRERWLKARQEERRWEARWRAAGENLKARNARPATAPIVEVASTLDPPPAPATAAEIAFPSANPAQEFAEAERALAVIEPPTAELAPIVGLDRPDVEVVAEVVESTVIATSSAVAEVVEPRLRPRRRKNATLGVTVDPASIVVADVPATTTAPALDATIWQGLLNLLNSTEPGGGSVFVPPPGPSAIAPSSVFDSTPGFAQGGPTALLESLAGEFAEEAHDFRASSPIADPVAANPTSATVVEGGPEWPSAQVILQQARRPSPVRATSPAGKAKRRPTARPVPTEARKPGHWELPGSKWLWVPTFGAALAAGAVALAMAATWAGDDQAAGIAADRLLGRDSPIAPEEARAILDASGGGTQWWRSTAGHLLHRAALADHAGPGGRAEALNLLNAARGASPAHAGVRLALARSEAGPGDLTRSLGLGRDVLSLAWTGRRLLEAGKVGPALQAYRSALAMAERAEPGPLQLLRDKAATRFALPGEDLMEAVVRDMASRPGWSFGQWEAALPRPGVAGLVAARVLKEEASPDADRAIEAVLAAREPGALLAAARAEANLLKERWEEAASEYRKAIGATADDRTRRAWSFNLADVYGHLNDDARRLAAWEAAEGKAPEDEVGRRVAAAKAQAGLLATARP